MLIGGGHYLLSTYYGPDSFPVYMLQAVSHLMSAAAQYRYTNCCPYLHMRELEAMPLLYYIPSAILEDALNKSIAKGVKW